MSWSFIEFQVLSQSTKSPLLNHICALLRAFIQVIIFGNEELPKYKKKKKEEQQLEDK
jgi:hypothetical protein